MDRECARTGANRAGRADPIYSSFPTIFQSMATSSERENGAAWERFDALARSQTRTESNRINILAGPPLRSSIKTLPATLPEPGQRPNPCSGGSLLITTRLFMGTPAIAGPDLAPPLLRGRPRTVSHAHDTSRQCIPDHAPRPRDPGHRFSNRIRSATGSAVLDQRARFLRQGLGLGL